MIRTSNIATHLSQERLAWITRAMLACVILYGMYAYYGHHAYAAMDKWVFTGDARQYLPPLFEYYDITLMNPDDYLGGMTRDTYLPLGYKVLYKLASYCVDPILFSKFLPYLLMMVFVTIMSFASKDIAGFGGFAATLVIALSTEIFFERMVGGLPRAFAYPITALSIWGMTSNRPVYLGVATILAAAFYPAIAPVSGIALVALMFCPSRIGGFDLSLSWEKRMVLVMVTALSSYLVFVPMYYHITQYGGLIATHDISEQLPDHYSAPLSFIYSTTFYSLSLFSQTLFPFALVTIVTSFCFACFQYQAARRLLIVILILFIGHWLLALFSDAYFSQRIKQFYIPVILLAMVPFFIKNIIYCLQSVTLKPIAFKYNWLLSCAFVFLILYVKPNQILPSTGLTVSIPPQEQVIYNFIQTLPKEGLVAGWPGEKDHIVDNVPYLSKHSAFFTEGSHREFYVQPQSLLRSRFKDLVDGYFATDPASIIYLRDHWNVRYLIVDLRHFKDHPPAYKKALNTMVERKWYSAQSSNKPFVILNYLSTATIFKQGSIFILDLSKIKVQ